MSREPEGIASRVLEVLGIDGKRIRTAVEFIVGQGDNSAREDIGLTDRAKKVIELAKEYGVSRNTMTNKIKKIIVKLKIMNK